jgi:hypothetical protein
LPEQVASRKAEWYVSFPPLPAILMMPIVAVGGLHTNDVVITVLWAALVPALLVGLLQKLRERGLSRRTEREDLWLVALFGVGTVFYYSAVMGEVWYTAHVVACLMVIGFCTSALEARRPAWAGVFLGLAVATRPHIIGLALLFALEAWRCRRAELARIVVRFALPAGAIGLCLAIFNQLRFGSPFEFGHYYLVIRWAGRIQRWGLFNYHFLSRNLAAAFVLFPKFIRHWPYVQYSRDGLSMLVTTPALVYAAMPRERPPITRALWLAVLAVALPSFLYQNDGFVQFGYRFSLDYLVLLVALLAIGAQPLTRTFQALVVLGIVINLYGALTFSGLGNVYFFEGFFPAQ